VLIIVSSIPLEPFLAGTGFLVERRPLRNSSYDYVGSAGTVLTIAQRVIFSLGSA
jgi:hypothetical protein